MDGAAQQPHGNASFRPAEAQSPGFPISPGSVTGATARRLGKLWRIMEKRHSLAELQQIGCPPLQQSPGFVCCTKRA